MSEVESPRRLRQVGSSKQPLFPQLNSEDRHIPRVDPARLGVSLYLEEAPCYIGFIVLIMTWVVCVGVVFSSMMTCSLGWLCTAADYGLERLMVVVSPGNKCSRVGAGSLSMAGISVLG